MTEMKMPDLSTTGSEVSVIRWLIEEGQPVKRGQPLLEIETDKATMEVESTITGTLLTIIAQPGANVATGDIIAEFET